MDIVQRFMQNIYIENLRFVILRKTTYDCVRPLDDEDDLDD